MNIDRIFENTDKEREYFKKKMEKAKTPIGTPYVSGVLLGLPFWKIENAIEEMDLVNSYWRRKVWRSFSVEDKPVELNSKLKVQRIETPS